ncbi:hypothetical protein FIV42_01175 [Persicimonas caeni]|uniref:Lipoprotein n=1 Tax=Persicimonas caeni TaxID=2292766 RepID=A0A4Y6PNK8_PERCE|nr:hypothetical protein [Persicimonas caeni]QDG49395.1 hypothetical protein FIV42_01175 [Persicimonas caeni]QED30616.1 hypothetical protein FRD00_01170 [Persicimonas caeni]
MKHLFEDRPRQVLTILAITGLMVSCGESGSGGDGSWKAPGRSADGWKQAFHKDGVRLTCDTGYQDAIDSDAPLVQIDETTLVVGYEQVGDNQNPILIRFEEDQQVYCRRHETEPPDGRALGLTWDGDDIAYVTYTVVGGGSALEGRRGWLDAYAPGAIHGGGPKVSYLGRVNITDGSLEAGSFIIAVKSDRSVNSHRPAGAPKVRDDGRVEFIGESAHKPIDPSGQASMDCTDYPFDSRYVFEPQLDTLVCASSTNCTSSQACDL